jgi:5S rRNA maturation endonuclease (ribonuclease M5)
MYPVKGKLKTWNASTAETGIQDLRNTSVALHATAFSDISSAVCQTRFIETQQALQDGMNTRVCNMCAKSHVRSQDGAIFECSHACCRDCMAHVPKRNEDGQELCRRDSCHDKVAIDKEFHMACHRCLTTFESLEHVFVLGCGHVVCEKCKDFMVNEDRDHVLTCYIGGCGLVIGGRVFRASELIDGAASGHRTVESLGTGGKLEKMVELIKEISHKKEKVIIFVPYEQQVSQVRKSLAHYAITYRDTLLDSDKGKGKGKGKDKDVGAIIHEFQTQDITALIQVVTGVEASGSNLVQANHVIFLSPLFCQDQEKWEMSRKQAVGRCFRHGQQKDVNVYHLVSEHTIESDILGHHLKKKLLRKRGEDRIKMPAECRTVLPELEAKTILDGEEFGCRYPDTELEYIFRTRDKGDTDGEGIF